MDKFPLPAITQERFTEYFSKFVPREDGIQEEIIFPGEPLPTNSRSRSLKKIVKPKHVFVTRVKSGNQYKYYHRLLGNDNIYSFLPKRLHSVCFPKIHLGSVPSNNRISIKISDKHTVELPFIPDDFFKQKQNKSERPSNKPLTRRNVKRPRTNSYKNNENKYISYSGWAIFGMDNETDDNNLKKSLLFNQLQNFMDYADDENIVVPHPFENTQDSSQNIQMLKNIFQFVYHYARDELRMRKIEKDTNNTDIWDKLKKEF